MVSSTVLTLIVIPAIYSQVKLLAIPAAHRERLAGVDALDSAVREGAADKRRVPLAGAGEIVEIATAPAQEAQILHAFDRRSNVSVGALQFGHAGRGIMFGHSVRDRGAWRISSCAEAVEPLCSLSQLAGRGTVNSHTGP